MKKMAIVSSQVQPDFYDKIKAEAGRKGIRLSEFVRRWLESYPYGQDAVIPVVLDVPKTLVGDAQGLRDFLKKKTDLIVSTLGKQ